MADATEIRSFELASYAISTVALSTVSHLQGSVEQGTVQDLFSTSKLVRLQIKRFDQGLVFHLCLENALYVLSLMPHGLPEEMELVREVKLPC